MLTISVIIPVLNEEAYLPKTLKRLKEQDPPAKEIFVVDGGSSDHTHQIAEGQATLLSSPACISKQNNLGARAATGDILVFLHADCGLEAGSFHELRSQMADTEIAGGGFRHELCGSRPWLDRYLSQSGSWNAKHSQTYLGDHGIFCRRTAFLSSGGFPEVPLMYEFEFMRNLRMHGRLIQLNKKCFASGRRFQNNGYIKTILLMRTLRTCYRLGLPTQTLQSIYRRNGS